MHLLGLKSEEQLDKQTLHRAGDRLVGERTALISQLRAIEFGNAAIAVPQPSMVCARRARA
jgi:transposase